MYDLKQDWTKLPSRVEMMRKRATRELDHPPSPDVQPKWDIPELVAVGAAVSGRIVRESDSGVTRNFALDFESFKREAILAIEAGACMVHLDPGGISAIMDSGLSVPEIYDRLYGSIVAETNRDWVPDVNILRGENFHENMYPVLAGMVETAPMAPFFPREWMESTAQVLADHGVKLFFSTHSTAEVDMADQFIVSKGLAPSPTCWIILIGYPYDDATQPAAAFLANPKAMMTELIQIVDRIREIDPDAFIMVCGSGRAGHYLVNTAMLLGLHVRVGTEDMAFRYPHRDIYLESNVECMERAAATANALGRRLATPQEFRDMLGIEKKIPVSVQHSSAAE